MPHSRRNRKKSHNSNANVSPKPSTPVVQSSSSFFSLANLGRAASNVTKQANSFASATVTTVVSGISMFGIFGSSAADSEVKENILLNTNSSTYIKLDLLKHYLMDDATGYFPERLTAVIEKLTTEGYELIRSGQNIPFELVKEFSNWVRIYEEQGRPDPNISYVISEFESAIKSTNDSDLMWSFIIGGVSFLMVVVAPLFLSWKLGVFSKCAGGYESIPDEDSVRKTTLRL